MWSTSESTWDANDSSVPARQLRLHDESTVRHNDFVKAADSLTPMVVG